MYKRVSHSKGTGFTQYDMVYTQAYIDFGQRKTARQLKFIDESGFKVTCGDRNYGHSKQGEPCIEIGRNLAGRNLPLNLSFGVILFCISISLMVPQTQPLPLLLARVIILSGPLPTTSIFLGDVVIVDNCAIPQKRVERILTQFLG